MKPSLLTLPALFVLTNSLLGADAAWNVNAAGNWDGGTIVTIGGVERWDRTAKSEVARKLALRMAQALEHDRVR